MNANDIEANWNKMIGGLRQKFGELTDDDMMQINGQIQELAGKLQERYDLSWEEADQVVTGLYFDEDENLQLKTTIQGEGNTDASQRFQKAQHEFANKNSSDKE